VSPGDKKLVWILLHIKKDRKPIPMIPGQSESTLPQHDLTVQEVEDLNAYGPYNHAVWQGRGVVISHEES
jgi:hypothetical protein